MSPEAPSYFRKPEIMELLMAIKEGRIGEIKPVFDHHSGFTYPEIDVVTGDPETTKETLKTLFENNILKREFYDAIVTCPSCGSHRISLILKCPSCGSTDLNKGVTLEHLHCGYVDLEGRFLKEERLICPNCGKELMTLGIDYRKPGLFYRCNSCGGMSQRPRHHYSCGDCGNRFEENEFSIKKFYKYNLDPKGKALLESWTIDFNLLLKELEKNGWVGEHPATLKGESGVKHDFTLVIRNPKEHSTIEYVVDIDIQDKIIDELRVLSFFAQTFDVKTNEKVLVAVPGLTQNARTLAESYNIIIKECPTASQVLDAVLEAVRGDRRGRSTSRLKEENEEELRERKPIDSLKEELEEVLWEWKD